ncbi:MAG: hypothetical protein R2762_29075 [Bryobacteraceae bacterium]
MKFREIFRFEFLYQARRVSTWLYFAVLFTVAYQLKRTAGGGDVLVPSPYEIAQDTVLTTLLWALMAPAVAGAAAARDLEMRTRPLNYTAPVSKAAYLGGRFLAAFVLNGLILAAVPLGILAAVSVSAREPGLVGSLHPASYLISYGVLALPTAFLFTAVQFSVAALKRQAIFSYLGTLLVFVIAGVPAALVLNVLQMTTLGQLLDPSCRLTVLIVIPEALTALEQSTLLIGQARLILANRLLWVCVALAILVFTHLRFRLDHRAE